tara:strand:+ start:365 stop:511 length:147 start_codon:yes stop_codon:yes gene_type:complete
MFGYKKGVPDCRPMILPDLVSAAVGQASFFALLILHLLMASSSGGFIG